MKQHMSWIVLASFLMFVAGCAENQTRIGEGAGIGAGLGALAGGIIGHQTHDTTAGILIGGAVGAAGGAAVGAQIPKEHQAVGVNQPVNQVTMQQVIDWTRQGLSSDDIISRIRTTNSTYALTGEDVSYLRRQGVSQRVVEIMQQAK